MTSAIILGDPHIGKGQSIGKVGIGANLNSRILDQLNLLDWTLDYADSHAIGNIIITGDVFEDPKPHPSLIKMFISWLKKCHANNVHVHVIMGNHDMIRSGAVFVSPLDIISEMDFDNVSVYKNINTIMIGQSSFTLIPFRDRKSFGVQSNSDALEILKNSVMYELAGIPITYKKIVVGHLAIEGSIPVGDEVDDIANELFCPVNMFSGYDYIFMGHVHKPQVLSNNKPYVSHIGSMDVSNFGESDHKKHIAVIDCDDYSANFKLELLPTRLLKKINLVIPKDTSDPTQFIIDHLKKDATDISKAIIKMDITMESPDAKSISKQVVEKYLISRGVHNISNISESKKVSLIKRDLNNKIDTKMDVVAAIKTYANTYVDAKIKSSFIEVATEIYNQYKLEAKE